ncbi:hypothetical protein [Actinomadura keratinilytica]|jgi:hypothetical protein|uniref:Uncharacterized protein n=2 Tax=Actinomadura keratinilytica TaxID=547461 RepID=A0ABP7ZHZ4_9ACTN
MTGVRPAERTAPGRLGAAFGRYWAAATLSAAGNGMLFAAPPLPAAGGYVLLLLLAVRRMARLAPSGRADGARRPGEGGTAARRVHWFPCRAKGHAAGWTGRLWASAAVEAGP